MFGFKSSLYDEKVQLSKKYIVTIIHENWFKSIWDIFLYKKRLSCCETGLW